MPKPTKRSPRKRAAKQLVLTGTEKVERDMRAAVKREKRVGKLQRQLRRALVTNRGHLAALALFLEDEGFIEPRPARTQAELLP